MPGDAVGGGALYGCRVLPAPLAAPLAPPLANFDIEMCCSFLGVLQPGRSYKSRTLDRWTRGTVDGWTLGTVDRWTLI